MDRMDRMDRIRHLSSEDYLTLLRRLQEELNICRRDMNEYKTHYNMCLEEYGDLYEKYKNIKVLYDEVRGKSNK